jgi:hypothetical protein
MKAVITIFIEGENLNFASYGLLKLRWWTWHLWQQTRSAYCILVEVWKKQTNCQSQGIGGIIILKCIVKEYMTGTFEHSNERSGFVRCGEFLDQSRSCHLKRRLCFKEIAVNLNVLFIYWGFLFMCMLFWVGLFYICYLVLSVGTVCASVL